MLDYPKALRSTGVVLLLCLAWFGCCMLVYVFMFRALYVAIDASPVGSILLFTSALVSAFFMIRGLLRRKPHIAYASLHAICWMASTGLAFLTQTTWLLISPLVCSIILFVFLQPILTMLSKIQIVVHSSPKGAAQDPPAYEQEYQTVHSEFTRSDEMYQKTELGRYYSGE